MDHERDIRREILMNFDFIYIALFFIINTIKTNPAASRWSMEADRFPYVKVRIAVFSLRRRAAGNLPVFD